MRRNMQGNRGIKIFAAFLTALSVSLSTGVALAIQQAGETGSPVEKTPQGYESCPCVISIACVGFEGHAARACSASCSLADVDPREVKNHTAKREQCRNHNLPVAEPVCDCPRPAPGNPTIAGTSDPIFELLFSK